jgi:hypothetical protein
MTEGESADEHCYSSKNRIEKIESADSADADEVEKRAFNAQVREGLVQTLEDPIYAMWITPRVCHVPLTFFAAMDDCNGLSCVSLNAPEPTQDIHSENGNTCPSGYASQCFLGAWFAVSESVAADHDRNQTCDFGYGSSE